MITGIENRTVSIDLLKAHPRNYRVHPEEQISNLCASYRRFGQFRSVVAVPDGQGYLMVAGHGFVEAMKREGATDVRVEVLPVNTPASTIEAIMVADNLHAQSAQDDEHALAALLQSQVDAGFSLESMGTDEDSLQQLLESLGDALDDDEYSEGDGSEDDVPENVETRCKLGDLWKLGEHRLLCGDSSLPENFERLIRGQSIDMVIADPPYGMKLDTQYSKRPLTPKAEAKHPVQRDYVPVIGDEQDYNPTFVMAMLRDVKEQFWWGADYYRKYLPDGGSWLVWDKREGIEDVEYTNASFELCWSKVQHQREILRVRWFGLCGTETQDIRKRVHPTQKPLEVYTLLMKKYLKPESIIYDPYLGSGTSVIAADRLTHTVYGCELSPEYIDVCIARWEQHTGQQAQLLERIEDPAHV